MGGDKRRISELQALADPDEEEAAVRLKSLKKRRNELENCDLEAEKRPKENKKKKRDLAGEENGGDGVIELKKKKREMEDAMEVEVSTSKKKNKKKRENNNSYLDETPLSAVQNDQSFEENGYSNPSDGGFHYRKPNESESYYTNTEGSELYVRNPNKSVIYFTDANEPGFDNNSTPHGQDSGPVQPELHMDVFRNLSSADASIRAAATLTLVKELQEVQKAYEQGGTEGNDDGDLKLEAAKDGCLKNCAPTMRYAIRRLIRGISSSRACARQGFALGFAAVVGSISCIEIEALLKLIEELLEVTSSMKGQEAREGLLGRLFAYGAIVRSGRLATEAFTGLDKGAGLAKDITQYLLMLAEKKSFMREPAVTIILDMVNKVHINVLSTGILEAPLLKDWLKKVPESGNPDALLLALKLHDKLPLEMRNLCKMLSHACNPSDLFTPEHMLLLVPALKETSFCHPRVHSVWQVLVDILFADLSVVSEDATSSHSSKKTKKSKKRNSPEKNLARRLSSFWEVVVEGSLLSSSHDRKHLAIDIFLMLLQRIPASCVQIVVSYKFVHCLLDILSAKDSHLYKSAQHCLQEIVNWCENDDEHRATVVIALQQNSNGKFDNISRTQTIRKLVSKFVTKAGCLLFGQKLTGLFLEGTPTQLNESSLDKSLTEEDDEMLGVGVKSVGEDTESLSEEAKDSDDVLRSWIVDSLYNLSKNTALDPSAKFPLQKEILKFLTVQGLFTASLGIEVTSFELLEKLKWPKKPASARVRRLCIEHMQHLLVDAQNFMISHKHTELNESMQHEVSPLESNDLGAYMMCFLGTLQNIPSVFLFWPLNKDDEDTFHKLHNAEAQLFRAACKGESNLSKMQAMRFLLIQLLLEIPLRPGEICETAAELLICCNKAFGNVIELVESNDDENETPALMDVLVDALLSLLPHSPAPVRAAVEQVFKCFCDSITESGLMNMLRIVKKDLKPSRHKPAVVEDSDEEDLIDIEESESDDEIEESENDENTDDILEQDSKVKASLTVDKKIRKEPGDSGGSEDSDSDFDDDAMFRMDAHLVQMLKEKKNAGGSDTAQTQLKNFKLRVLSLLEYYLQRNSSKPLVLTVYSYLLQAFVSSSSIEGNEQFADRLGVIIQRKICKAKEYPKGPEVDLSLLQDLFEKVLKSASRSKAKKVQSLSQICAFWLLKVIHGNSSETELKKVSEIFLKSLEDFFVNKKCRLKGGFLKELFRRHPWVGISSFGMLIEKCRNARSEFLQFEALSLMDTLIRPWLGKSTEVSSDKDSSHNLQFLKVHLPSLSELVQHFLQKPAKKASHRSEARQFCMRIAKALSLLKLEKSFAKLLKHSSCESQLGDLFRPYKNLVELS